MKNLTLAKQLLTGVGIIVSFCMIFGGYVYGADRAALDQQSSSPESQHPAEFQVERDWRSLIMLTPYYESTTFTGYRIYPGPDRKGFASLRLRPGDLLTKLGGEPVPGLKSANRIFEMLNNGNTIIVTIERGRSFTEMELTWN